MRLPEKDEPWLESVSFGRQTLDTDWLTWIQSFGDTIAQQLRAQLPQQYQIDSLELGCVLRIARDNLKLDLHLGEMLTNSWQADHGTRVRRTEITVRDLLNQLGTFREGGSKESIEPEPLRSYVQTSVDLQRRAVTGRLESGSSPTSLEIFVEVRPEPDYAGDDFTT